MLFTLLLLPCLTQGQSFPDYFYEDVIPAYGSSSGEVTRIVAGHFDPGAETPDMILLQGSSAEFHMDPSVPTPSWLTGLTSSSVNDIAVLHGAGAWDEDVALTVGPNGLEWHKWAPQPGSTFVTSVMRAGSWLGATKIHIVEESATTTVLGLSASGSELLRVDLDGASVTDLSAIALPPGLGDILNLDWDGDGDQEVVLHFPNLAIYVIDSSGSIVDSFSTIGSDEKLVVSRSELPGEAELLLIAAFDASTGDTLVVGLNDNDTITPFVVGGFEALSVLTADLDSDGRGDLLLHRSLSNSSSPALGHAEVTRFLRTSELSVGPLGKKLVLSNQTATGELPLMLAPADFDEDGDVDLGCPSRDGTIQRIWYNDHIEQDYLRPNVYFLPPPSTTTASLDLDLNVEVRVDLTNADSVLLEIWRVSSVTDPLVFDSQRFKRIVAPIPPVGPLQSVSDFPVHDVQFTSASGVLDHAVFRIDATLVETEPGTTNVIRHYTTSSSWLATDPNYAQSIEDEAEWPVVQWGSSPESTSGNVSGSGSTSGMDPPNTRTGG